MTWNGSKLTIAGFTAIFSDFKGFSISDPVKNDDLGIYECMIDGTDLIRAKTLVDLARKTINQLIEERNKILATHCSEIYCHCTNNTISKPETDPREVMQIMTAFWEIKQ